MDEREKLESRPFAYVVQAYERVFASAVPGDVVSLEAREGIYYLSTNAVGLTHERVLEAAQLAARRLGGTIGIQVEVIDEVPIDAKVTPVV